MNILIDAPSWFYNKNNTDIRLRKQLADGLRDLGVSIPSGLIWNLVYNIGYVATRCCSRLRCRWLAERLSSMFSACRGILLSMRRPDIVISQGPNPPINHAYKMLWETYFLNESFSRTGDPEFNRRGKNPWIRQMRRYGSKVDCIAVRGRKSVANIRALFPELGGKVRDLGFVRPEFRSIAESDVEEKQLHDSKIEILFVGREAKRKGLDSVLSACHALYEHGVRNFHLCIVSDLFNSRDIVVPNVSWVTWHRGLPHEDVMKLMRKAQIFIMPSRFDSYGLVYHEAMANGCVTFVRNGEPQLDFVAYGKAGCFVSCDDIADMECKLRSCIEDKKLRLSLAVGGWRRYLQEYSQAIVRRNWRDALKGMI